MIFVIGQLQNLYKGLHSFDRPLINDGGVIREILGLDKSIDVLRPRVRH